MTSLSSKCSLLFVSLFFTSIAYAQSDLVFSKRFVEAEDKWVAFQKGKDSTYVFGFIYLDQMAGLTLNYEGNFTIGEGGRFIRKSVLDSLNASYKVRLQPNNVKVALIPAARFAELKIEATPDWLDIYKSYKDTARRLQRWGYYYNDFGMSEKALEYLEPGYKLDPAYKGMAVELAFAYNALEKFEKAIPVLEKAIVLTPEDGYLYKELSYAYFNIDKMEEAEKAALKGIKYYNDNNMKAEIAYNIAYTYFTKKDKKNFSKWVAETKKWAAKGGQIDDAIQQMEEKIKE